MKKCTVCELEKKEIEFAFKDKKKRTLCAHCKECQREKNREYYEDHYAERIAKAKITNLGLLARNRKFLFDYLSTHHCCTCGESDPLVLEFNHRDPKKKTFNVSKAVQQKLSIKKIENEIAKCDVMCANCHRRHTAKQLGWYKYEMGM